MELTPRLLEQFVVLTEEKHFGRAAQRLSMSQPPLTQAVQRLERGIGVALIDRSTRGVRLTPAGAAFAADARRLLDAQTAAIERARRIAAGGEGEVRLGFAGGLTYEYVPKLVAWTAAELPDLRLHVQQHLSGQMAELLRTGTLDLALVHAPLAVPDSLAVQEIGTQRCVAVLPTGHPLAGRAELSLADLREEYFVMLGERSLPDLRRRLQAAFQQAGFNPRVRAYADDLPGILSCVTSGTCVSLALLQTDRLSVPGAVFVPLSDRSALLESTVAIVHRRDDDPAVRAIVDLMLRHITAS